MSREHVIGDPRISRPVPTGSNVGRREIGVFNIGGKLYGLPTSAQHPDGSGCSRASPH